MAYRPSRRLIISALAGLVLVGAFILILPELARRLAVDRLQSVFIVPVEIQDVDINLFTGRAAIENLIVGADNPQPILSIPGASIDFSRLGLLKGQIDLNSVALQNPTVFLERLGPTTYNVLKAIDFGKESPQAGDHRGDAVSFSIERLEIHGGQVVFIDQTQEPDYKVTFSSLE
ncbi:MAG TPA: hypothetical protein VHM64_16300, partial [Candidatus Binatia bacterium]|nr:hypothetical protein [Candidatus Binatia bacterium]